MNNLLPLLLLNGVAVLMLRLSWQQSIRLLVVCFGCSGTGCRVVLVFGVGWNQIVS